MARAINAGSQYGRKARAANSGAAAAGASSWMAFSGACSSTIRAFSGAAWLRAMSAVPPQGVP